MTTQSVEDAPQDKAQQEARKVRQHANAVEGMIDSTLDLSASAMTPEQADSLSKALFPETHTNVVTLLGVDRVLRPLPIKATRKLYSLLKPLAQQAQDESDGSADPGTVMRTPEDAETEFENTVLKNLTEIVLVLAEFYNWDDVQKAVGDEDLSLYELEELANTQQELNSANDFLLQPLRIFIKLLQAREIAMVLLEGSLTMSTTQPSADSGNALLRSLLGNILPDN